MSMFSNFSPYIRHASDHVILPPWYIRPRVLLDYELLYLKEGKLKIRIEDQEYIAEPGDIYLFKPRQQHTIQLLGKNPVRQPHVHFDLTELPDSPEVRISFRPESEMSENERKQFRPDLLTKGPLSLPNFIKLAQPKVFEQMLQELIKEFSMKLPFYEINCKAILLRLLSYIAREQQWSRAPHVQSHLHTLLNIQQYLHASEQEITMNELAEMFRISKYYLNRLFSDAFGMAPIQYHQTMRIQKAKQFLQYTQLPIQEIADRLGYQNIHSFSRAFKNKEGIAPSHYRQG